MIASGWAQFRNECEEKFAKHFATLPLTLEKFSKKWAKFCKFGQILGQEIQFARKSKNKSLQSKTQFQISIFHIPIPLLYDNWPDSFVQRGGSDL